MPSTIQDVDAALQIINRHLTVALGAQHANRFALRYTRHTGMRGHRPLGLRLQFRTFSGQVGPLMTPTEAVRWLEASEPLLRSLAMFMDPMSVREG